MNSKHILVLTILLFPFVSSALVTRTTELPGMPVRDDDAIQVGDVTISPDGDITAGDVTVSNDSQSIQTKNITVTPGLVQIPNATVTGDRISVPGVEINTKDNQNMVAVDLKTLKEDSGVIVVSANGVTVSTTNATVRMQDGDITIQKDGDTVTMRAGDVAVTTNTNIHITDGTISVTTPTLDIPLIINPQEALKKLGLDNTDEATVQTMQLVEEDGNVLYRVTAQEFKKLLGLIPVTLGTTGEISATQAADAVLRRPWWSFLAF